MKNWRKGHLRGRKKYYTMTEKKCGVGKNRRYTFVRKGRRRKGILDDLEY